MSDSVLAPLSGARSSPRTLVQNKLYLTISRTRLKLLTFSVMLVVFKSYPINKGNSIQYREQADIVQYQRASIKGGEERKGEDLTPVKTLSR